MPRANLLYSPRNKILATSLLIEAILYEEQTRRGVALAHYDEFGDVADHCTICHKCEPACPVDIDFGDVSITMRNYLRRAGKRRFNPGTRRCSSGLTDPRAVKMARTVMVDWGYRLQKLAHEALKCRSNRPPRRRSRRGQGATRRWCTSSTSHAGSAAQDARALLDIEDARVVPIIRDPAKVTEDSDAVFYFPGCGSERLFSQVGLATQAMLYEIGAQCVLPPGYLCCGYPQTAAGESAKGERIIVKNRVLFHRLATTLNYLDIRTVIVSCGTSRPARGLRLRLDLSRRAPSRHPRISAGEGREAERRERDEIHVPRPLPHADQDAAARRGRCAHGRRVPLSERCCGESGTLALTRPDVSTQVRFSKEESLRKARGARAAGRCGEGADLLSFMPAGTRALRARHRCAGRLHCRRDGAAHPG